MNYSESEKPWEVAKGRAVAEEREGKEGVREEGGWAGGEANSRETWSPNALELESQML